MDRLETSRRKRLQRDIKRLPGLLVYYPLNEVTGNARNYAPGRVDSLSLTVSGAVTAAGRRGRALTFDGSNDYGEIAANSLPAWTGKSAVGFLIQVLTAEAVDDFPVDSQFGDDGGGGFQIQVNNGLLGNCYVGDKTNRDNANAGNFNLTAREYFVIIVKDTTAGYQRVYVDAVQKGENTSLGRGTTEPDTGIAMRIAASREGSRFLHCKMSHVFIVGGETVSAAMIRRLAHACGVI